MCPKFMPRDDPFPASDATCDTECAVAIECVHHYPTCSCVESEMVCRCLNTHEKCEEEYGRTSDSHEYRGSLGDLVSAETA